MTTIKTKDLLDRIEAGAQARRENIDPTYQLGEHTTDLATAIEQHRLEARWWQAQRQMCTANGVFPRARNGCITRYGKCPEWEHCLTGE